jgi:hypothetical protein
LIVGIVAIRENGRQVLIPWTLTMKLHERTSNTVAHDVKSLSALLSQPHYLTG